MSETPTDFLQEIRDLLADLPEKLSSALGGIAPTPEAPRRAPGSSGSTGKGATEEGGRAKDPEKRKLDAVERLSLAGGRFFGPLADFGQGIRDVRRLMDSWKEFNEAFGPQKSRPEKKPSPAPQPDKPQPAGPVPPDPRKATDFGTSVTIAGPLPLPVIIHGHAPTGASRPSSTPPPDQPRPASGTPAQPDQPRPPSPPTPPPTEPIPEWLKRHGQGSPLPVQPGQRPIHAAAKSGLPSLTDFLGSMRGETPANREFKASLERLLGNPQTPPTVPAPPQTPPTVPAPPQTPPTVPAPPQLPPPAKVASLAQEPLPSLPLLGVDAPKGVSVPGERPSLTAPRTTAAPSLAASPSLGAGSLGGVVNALSKIADSLGRQTPAGHAPELAGQGLLERDELEPLSGFSAELDVLEGFAIASPSVTHSNLGGAKGAGGLSTGSAAHGPARKTAFLRAPKVV